MQHTTGNKQSPSALRAERYLQRAGALENDIELKLRHLHCLRTRVPKGIQSSEGHSNTPCDRTGDNAVRIEELQNEIEALRRQLERARNEIKHTVQRIPDPRRRCMLEMRYLSHLTWDEISDSLCISPRAALRLHQRALETINILLQEQ